MYTKLTYSLFLSIFAFLGFGVSAQYIPFAFWKSSCSHEYNYKNTIEASDKSSDDRFGRGVAMSSDGTTFVVGAWKENNSGNDNAGSAYIFTKVAGVWTEQQKITGGSSNPEHDQFGESISISGDGNTIVIGTKYQDDDSAPLKVGMAYVFEKSGATWTETAQLTASDQQADDEFGYSVAISKNGSTIIVGAHNEDTGGTNAGSAYVFQKSGATWSEQAKIQGSDTTTHDSFGSVVDISSDGNTAAISADAHDGGAANTGAVYVFTRSGATWTQHSKLLASDKAADDDFGEGMSMNDNGDVLVAGSPKEDTTAGTTSNAGSSYVFRLSGGVWSQEAKLEHAGPGVDDFAGAAITISGNGKVVYISSDTDDQTATDSGAVFVFKNTTGSTWVEKTTLKDTTPATGNEFGSGVGVDNTGRNVVVGSENYFNQQGKGHIFKCK